MRHRRHGTQAADRRNPYRGLEAFRLADADRFFGRNELVEKLWQHFPRLHKEGDSGKPMARLLTMVGASGSGKSSVAQAGLLAAIRGRPVAARSDPRIAIFTPATKPLESLAMALARLISDDPTPVVKASEFEKILQTRKDADGLRYLVDKLPDKHPVILLIDQFEETYSLCDDEDERLAFIDNLLNAVRQSRGHLSAILTLRTDFLGAINHHVDLSNLIASQHEVVDVMKEEELREAIVAPSISAGREFDPAIVDLLIEQSANEQGALPLLQFVLTRLWDGLGAGKSEQDGLRDLNGVRGAVAKEAEELFKGLEPDDQAIARRSFLAMVRLGEGTRDTRRRASIDEIVAAGEDREHVERILRIFADPRRRLVTLNWHGRGRTDGGSQYSKELTMYEMAFFRASEEEIATANVSSADFGTIRSEYGLPKAVLKSRF